jgi:beta-lactamase regulating signal transducer with metallopeptidase domain
MTLTNYLLNAYIDANILLIFAFGVWALARFILGRFGFSQAFGLQLKLLNGVFLAVAVSPFFCLAFDLLIETGTVSQSYAVSLSDIVLAQYLNGGFAMQPSQLEYLLGIRSEMMTALVGFNTLGAMFVAACVAIGFSVGLFRILRSMMALNNIIGRSYEWRQFGNLHLRLSDTNHVPFSTRSLRRRYIVLPSAMLGQSDDLKMALAHEFQHLRQGDVEWEIALEALRPLFFWNPVFIFWKRQVDQLRELSCDQQVLARNNYDVKAYCECLFRVCRNSLRQDSRQLVLISSVPFAQIDRSLLGVNSAAFLRRRMTSVFDAKKVPQGRGLSGVLSVFLMGLVISISVAMTNQGDWSQDRLMLSAIVNLERLHGPTHFGG